MYQNHSLYRICWIVKETLHAGNGEYILDYVDATNLAIELNKKHSHITHWIEKDPST